MEESYRLNPDMQTFETWLAKSKRRLLERLQLKVVAEGVS
jgi:hypothetical protein